jgi:uncharacterized protein
MRIVIDSNVLARATPGKTNAARELLMLAILQPHTLITSVPLLTELARMLQYPRVRALHGLDDAGIHLFLQSFQAASLIVTPVIPPPIQTNDPDDDVVIATAIAGRADAVCTWDQHMHKPAIQSACGAIGIRVIRDGELLRELRAGSSQQPGTP